MFEAVITLCLALDTGACRDQLLPGYEAPERAQCEEALAQNPPAAGAGGEPFCQKAGEALSFEEAAPGVFVHMGRIEEPGSANRGDVSNIGFIIGDDSVAVIDAGSAPWMGEAIFRAVRLRTQKPVSHLILTHMHPDHVFGAAPFILPAQKSPERRGLSAPCGTGRGITLRA